MDITPSNTVFFLCDVQETFRRAVPDMPKVIAVSVFFDECAKALGIPIVATEQKPFKATCEEIPTTGDHVQLFKKTQYSMLIKEVRSFLRTRPAIRHVVLYGLEGHVCVLQTALDLVRHGYQVQVVVDGVGSQRPLDQSVALDRMRRVPGITMTTAEAVVLELVKDGKNPSFKPIVPHLKTLSKAFRAHSQAASAKL